MGERAVMTVRALSEALGAGKLVRWQLPARLVALGGLPRGVVSVMPCCDGRGGAPDLEAGSDGLSNKLIVSNTRGTPRLYRVIQVRREKSPESTVLMVRPAGGAGSGVGAVWIRREDVVGVLSSPNGGAL